MDATWRALADPTRRRLIELLRDGPRTTGELCRTFATSRFAVMKHLRVLERGGLLVVSREGRRRWNTLNPEKLRQVGGRWAGVEPPAAAAVAAKGGAMVRDGGPPGEREASTEVFVDAVPWKVFDALTVNVAAWWGPPHLRSADASNLVLEPQPGGRFYEEWGHRQGALRGFVTAIRQDERLELGGPLFAGAGDARLGFHLENREGGTLMTVSSRDVSGDVIDDLFRVRLKAFVERGLRSGVAG
jgi:DNA-binding transcriptional ArsR family regulator